MANRDAQQQHHREAGKDGPGHEVGREDRLVPGGQVEIAKSELTTEWTEITSGVASPARSR